MSFRLALADRGQDRFCPALRSSAVRVTATIPTFGKLALNSFAAAVAVPGFFYRLQRRQCLLKNRSGPAEFFIINYPELRPALDRRQLSGGADQVAISGDALDTERG